MNQTPADDDNGDVRYEYDYPLVGESEVVYWSFLYKPVTGEHPDTYWSQMQIGADMARDNNQRGRIGGDIDLAASLPSHTVEIRFRNNDAAEYSTPIAIDTTVLVVGKLTMVPGITNDTFEAWIDPDPTAVEPAAHYTATGDPGEDIDPSEGFVGFSFRLRDNSGDFEYDELRIGTTWESVMGREALPADLVPSADPVVLPIVIAGVNESSSRIFTVSNGGSEALEITAATVAGEGFSLIQPVAGDFPVSLGGGLSTPFEVGFDRTLLSNPSAAGVIEGTLSLDSNDPDSPSDITLQVEVLTGKRPAEAQVWMLYED